MSLLLIIEKIGYLIILILAGVITKHFKIITDKSERDLSALLVDFLWPILIFSQITESLNSEDISRNFILPVMALVTGLTGYGIGLLITRIKQYQQEKKQIFLYHTTINNFVFMVLPLISYLLPGKGMGLLFVHNLGMIFLIWTLGIYIFKGSLSLKESFLNLLTPGLIITVFSILLTLCGLNRFIPSLVADASKTIGNATLPVAMIIAGSSIYNLGKRALKFDSWNIFLMITRLILIPFILLGLTLLLKIYFHFSREVLLIFMLVNIMPVSINSVGVAIRFNSRKDLAAQGIVMTHLFSIVTIPLFILFFEKVF